MLSAHAGRAEALDRLGRRAEALKDWDRALEFAKTADARRLRCYRLLSAGQPAEAVNAAEELARAKDVRGETVYSLARVSSLASVGVMDDTGAKERYAARTVGLLRQASERGYDPAAQMKSDPALAALRAREDFKKLLAELEAKQKAAAK